MAILIILGFIIGILLSIFIPKVAKNNKKDEKLLWAIIVIIFFGILVAVQ